MTRTLSLPPVAPSISSIMSKTGFVLPIAEPDSSMGRTRSSIDCADRVSLWCVWSKRRSLCTTESPGVDFHYFVTRLRSDDVG